MADSDFDEIAMPSARQISARRSETVASAMRRRSWRWQRESTVNGIFSGFVVAKMKRLRGGGSSRVFSSALKAAVESMWTSSMMKMRWRPGAAA